MNEAPQQYTERILSFMSGKEPLEVQRETPKTLLTLINPLTKEELRQRPQPGKWSITEILAHFADSEIVLSSRMRLVICQNGVALQATDQDAWSQTLDYAGQDPRVSLETFRLLRENNCACCRLCLRIFGKTTACIRSAARKLSHKSFACMQAMTLTTWRRWRRS